MMKKTRNIPLAVGFLFLMTSLGLLFAPFFGGTVHAAEPVLDDDLRRQVLELLAQPEAMVNRVVSEDELATAQKDNTLFELNCGGERLTLAGKEKPTSVDAVYLLTGQPELFAVVYVREEQTVFALPPELAQAIAARN